MAFAIRSLRAIRSLAPVVSKDVSTSVQASAVRAFSTTQVGREAFDFNPKSDPLAKSLAAEFAASRKFITMLCEKEIPLGAHNDKAALDKWMKYASECLDKSGKADYDGLSLKFHTAHRTKFPVVSSFLKDVRGKQFDAASVDQVSDVVAELESKMDGPLRFGNEAGMKQLEAGLKTATSDLANFCGAKLPDAKKCAALQTAQWQGRFATIVNNFNEMKAKFEEGGAEVSANLDVTKVDVRPWLVSMDMTSDQWLKKAYK